MGTRGAREPRHRPHTCGSPSGLLASALSCLEWTGRSWCVSCVARTPASDGRHVEKRCPQHPDSTAAPAQEPVCTLCPSGCHGRESVPGPSVIGHHPQVPAPEHCWRHTHPPTCQHHRPISDKNNHHAWYKVAVSGQSHDLAWTPCWSGAPSPV